MGIAFSDPPGEEDLVNHDPVALLVAMLLDQQISIELAFRGPARLAARVGGDLDPARLAAMDPEEFAGAAAVKPAIHRFPAAMAKRIQALCAHLVDQWDGNPARIWDDGAEAETVAARLADLPGFGPEKVKITMAVLAKRFGIAPAGWQTVAGAFADDLPRSVADVGGPADLARLRSYRKDQKAAGKGKAD